MSKEFDPYYQWLGIPPDEQPPDHYRLLGLQRFESDENVISNAADRQMSFLRTFQQGKHSGESQKILNEVSTARLCLINAAKRRDYDAGLRQKLASSAVPAAVPVAPAVAPPAASPVPFSGSSSSVFGPGSLPAAAPLGQAAAMSSISQMGQPPGVGPVADPFASLPSPFDPRPAAPASVRPVAPTPASPVAPTPVWLLAGGAGTGVAAMLLLLYLAGMFSRKPTAITQTSSAVPSVATPAEAAPEASSSTTANPAPSTTSSVSAPATTPASTPPLATPPSTPAATEPAATEPAATRPRFGAANSSAASGNPAAESGGSTGSDVAAAIAGSSVIPFGGPAAAPAFAQESPPNLGYRAADAAAAQTQDLMPDDWTAGVFRGQWTKVADGWRSNAAGGTQVDFASRPPPAAYTLTLRIERISGDGGFIVGLPWRGKLLGALIGEHRNTLSGVASLDGRSLEESYLGAQVAPNTLPVGKPQTILATVSETGVWVRVGDAETEGVKFSYTGDPARLTLHPTWPPRHGDAIFFGSANAAFKITQAAFRASVGPYGSPVRAKVAGAASLLGPIDPADVARGEWKFENGTLLLSDSPGRARLQFPVARPTSYRLIVECRRLPAASGSSKRIAFGTPVGASQAMLSLDGPEGAGFGLVAGAFQAHAYAGLLIDDQPHVVEIEQRTKKPNEASLVAKVDGKVVAEWQGDPSAIETPAAWRPLDPQRVWIGADCPLAISRATLEPLDGSSSRVPPRRPSLGLAVPTPGEMQNAPLVITLPPDDRIKERMDMDFGRIPRHPIKETPEEDQALLRRVIFEQLTPALLEHYATTRPASTYATLRYWQQRSVGWRVSRPLVEAGTLLGETFAVNRWDVTADAMPGWKRDEKFDDYIRLNVAFASAALTEDQYDAANRFAPAARTKAMNVAPREFIPLAQNLQTRVQRFTERGRSLETARATLASNPQDAAAQAVVGLQTCLVDDDWATGLPLLLKAPDEALRRAAEGERDAPSTSNGAAALADLWLQAAEKAAVYDQHDIRLRARKWLLTAREKANGLEITRLDKLLADLSLAPLPLLGREYLNGVGMTFCWCPSGEFEMGSPDDEAKRLSDEQRHRVRISRGFWLGKYEVTVGEFRRFVEESGYLTDPETDGRGGVGWDQNYLWAEKPAASWKQVDIGQTEESPVVNVTWHDAQAFCGWLSQHEGAIYRLPTEAEWEYACRAGTSTRFEFGNEPNVFTEYANLADASAQKNFQNWPWAVKEDDGFVYSSPVGRFKPNSWGLHDMYGNAGEWCADWYGDYGASAEVSVDPQGPATGDRRVIRGGAWNTGPDDLRSARRDKNKPDFRYFFSGFRVVLER